MTPVVWLLALLAVAFVTGAASVVRGWRGRRIDDHPLCRRCGFDLTGKPADSTICSECGADVSRPRAVVRGHRRRRPGLVLAGLALVMLSLAPIAGIGWMQVRRLDPNRLKPTWLLVREARMDAGPAQAALWGELQRRLVDGSLPAEWAGRLVEHVLDCQADGGKTWLPAWGDFVETARRTAAPDGASALVSDEQWKRYARQAPNLTLELRPKVGRAEPLVLRVVSRASRVGSRSSLALRIGARRASGDLVVPPRKPSGSSSTTFSLSLSGTSSTTVDVELDPQQLAAAPAGEKRVGLALEASVREGFGEVPSLVAWEHGLAGTWELVDEPTVTWLEAPDQRAAVEGALSVKDVKCQSGDPDHVSLTIVVKRPPVPLAFDVLFRDPASGREWKVASIACGPGRGSGENHYGTGGQAKGLTADAVDVVFRPSLEAAKATVDMTQVWNGEVVIRDVPVERPKAPATTEPAVAR